MYVSNKLLERSGHWNNYFQMNDTIFRPVGIKLNI